jgi:cytochrome c oxidase subunit 2
MMPDTYGPLSAASKIASEVDSVYIFITGIALFFFIITQGALIYFAFRYRRKKGEPDVETPYITSNKVLEGVWVAIPTILVMCIFVYGYIVWEDMRTPLPDAEEIHVTARQWLFKFTYPDGRETVNDLRIPAGQAVKLTMTSEDVIHAFFVPELREKQDILPGRYTYLWLKPERTGTYTIYCTQYCGVGHSQMTATLSVMEPHEYQEWAAKQVEEAEKTMPLAQKGKNLVEQSGCLACHSTDGSIKVGPSFKDLFGSTVRLSDGKTVTADADYIHESILDPGAKIVAGFRNLMPTFKGILKDDDITAIIAYMQTLSAKGGVPAATAPAKQAIQPTVQKGKAAFEGKGCIGCHSTDGSLKVGPTFKGLYGSVVTLSDGKTMTADDAYIRESIYEPGAKVVKGFGPVMPSYKGTVDEEELQSIVLYIKSLK